VTLAEAKRLLRHGPWAWPGGYPMYFICDDGEALCFACVRKEWRQVVHAHLKLERDQWRLATYDTNWEDPELRCAHCDVQIQSAYTEVAPAPS
jgi:hypothetical protein